MPSQFERSVRQRRQSETILYYSNSCFCTLGMSFTYLLQCKHNTHLSDTIICLL